MSHLQHTPPPSPYLLNRIAWEIEQTALGNAFFGNSLYVARDVPGLSDEQREILTRFATGAQQGTDHVTLQSVANRLREIERNESALQTLTDMSQEMNLYDVPSSQEMIQSEALHTDPLECPPCP